MPVLIVTITPAPLPCATSSQPLLPQAVWGWMDLETACPPLPGTRHSGLDGNILAWALFSDKMEPWPGGLQAKRSRAPGLSALV